MLQEIIEGPDILQLVDVESFVNKMLHYLIWKLDGEPEEKHYGREKAKTAENLDEYVDHLKECVRQWALTSLLELI